MKRFLCLNIFIALMGAIGFASNSKGHPSVIYKEEQLVQLEASSIKQITVPIVYENGVLFTYSGKEEDEVYISGEFWGWTKKKKLPKNLYGIYYLFVPLEVKKGTYPYRYIINDIWVNDPEQTHYVHDGYGTKISAFVLQRDLTRYVKSPKYIGKNRFEFFLKDRGFKEVSIVGTRNNWDPFVDFMTLKNGYWTITLDVHPKKTFYKYWVDGETILDPRNPDVGMRKHNEKINFISQ